MAGATRQIRGVVKVRIRLRPDGTPYPYWYADFKTSRGWIRNRRTDVPSTAPEAEAIVDARRIQAEHFEPRLRAERELTLLDALVIKHAHDEERVARGELAESTLASYAHIAGRLRESLDEEMLFADLDRHVVKDWEQRRLRVLSRHTVTKERNYLRALVRLMRHEELSTQAVDDVFAPGWRSGYVPRKRWLPPEEADALVAACSPKRAAHVAYFLATGADWFPSLSARRRDFDWSKGDGVIFVHGTKTEHRRREVPILPYTRRFAERACAWLTIHGTWAKWSSGSKNRDLKVACRRAGIPPCSFKDLRRTVGMWVHQRGGHAGLTALFLGHSDTSMVMRTYGRLEGDELGRALQRGEGREE